jgi:hypothetical protein
MIADDTRFLLGDWEYHLGGGGGGGRTRLMRRGNKQMGVST